jgi:outer membrane protein assembly factor BamB
VIDMRSLIAAILLALVGVNLSPARAGDLLLAGFGGDTIYRFDGSSATAFATDPGGPNSMDGPTALVYDSGGNLLVLNEFSHNVLKFNGTTGAFMSTFIASTALGAAGIGDPGDMELGADGNLYIMGHFNDGGANVAKFSGTTGASLGTFAFTTPVRHQHGLAFGTAGDLYQGNVASGLIERYNGTSGAAMGSFTSSSVGPIADLAFGPTKLYVTCDGGGGVARYIAATGVADGYLVAPGNSYWGILVDSGNLWVSNTSTGTLRKFDATSGALLADYTVGGGAFDIIAMPAAIPEPAASAVLFGAMAAVMSRRRR